MGAGLWGARSVSKPRPRLERYEQADGVKLLRMLGAAVYVLGTVRPRGDHPGTRQTPGLPDVQCFLPMRGGARVFLCWEVKSAAGRLRPEQAIFRDHCKAAGVAHVTGDLTALMAWLVSAGYLTADQLPHGRQAAAWRARETEGR